MFSPDRLEGDKGDAEVAAPQAQPTELELRRREQELKARYEDPRRKVEAQKVWNKRKEIREQEKVRKEKLQALLQSTEDQTVSYVESSVAPLMKEHTEITTRFDTFSSKEQALQQEQQGRNFFQKLKYKVVHDPIADELKKVALQKEAEAQALASQEEKIKELKQRAQANLAHRKEDLQGNDVEGQKIYESAKKALLEKTRTSNKNSREAIRNTFLSMEKGELDIAKLAKESNAVVVHTIPLDGWHMGSTSMNNEEANTNKLTAKEKTDIILTKQPDLSASVLSVETRAGQDMFYPFGYILDGKLIASYDKDEGTVASGDARHRKEEFHGTLQKDAKGEFARVAETDAIRRASTQHNESIVHKPEIKGILLDEAAIAQGESYFPGDEVREMFASKEEEEKKMPEYKKLYGDSIINSSEEIRNDMGIEPKTLFVTRKRTGLQKAIEYAKQTHPELPIYVRKVDGIYTIDGKKVTAEDIYA